MKKHRTKKLSLSRETLVLMNVRAVAAAQGESGGSDCVTTTWQKDCNCGAYLAE